MDLLYVVTAESCVEAANENHSTVGVDLNDGVNTLPLYTGKEDSVCVTWFLYEISALEILQDPQNDGTGSGGSSLAVLWEKTRMMCTGVVGRV